MHRPNPMSGMPRPVLDAKAEMRALSCCRFRGHEDKFVIKELESGYDETEVQP